MGIGNFLGGIGNAYQGFKQGQDEEIARQRSEADRAQQELDRKHQSEQRAYQASQQARTVAEQGRADTLRTDLSSIPTETETNFRNPDAPQLDDEGTPSAAALDAKTVTAVPQDVQLRKAAVAYRKAGDMEGWLKNHQQADKIAWDRSSKAFQELAATAASESMTAEDVARQAAAIYSNDPFAGKITNVRPDGKGGVIIDATNRETGAVNTKAFPTKAALLESLHSYYSPESYARLQSTRAEAAVKAQEKGNEERAKGHVLPAGAQFVPGVGDPRKPVTNDTGYIQDGTNPDGTPRIIKAGKGGDGAGKKTAVKELIDEAGALIKDAIKNPEDPNAYLLPQSYLDGIYRSAPGTPPRTAAMIAVDAARNPAAVMPQINARDGSVSLIYSNPKFESGRAFNLAPGGASIQEMEKAQGGPAKMVPAVQQMLAKQSNQDTADAIVKAAADPKFNAEVEAQIRTQARPEALQADLQAWKTKVLLVATYLPAKTEKKPEAKRDWRAPVGGVYQPDPASPAGKAHAVRAQAQAKADEKSAAVRAEQAALSVQFQRDAKTMAPIDLARKYDDLRGQLPTADAAQLQSIEQQIR